MLQVEDGVAGVLGPGAAAVVAVGEVLGLEGLAVAGARRVAGVDGDHAWLAGGAEAAGIVLVHDRAAGEDHDAVFFGERHGQFLPVDEVAADGVAPTHVAPGVAERVVLVEEVVFAVEPDQAVGVVGPVLARREMELRAIGFAVRLAKCRGQARDEKEQEAPHWNRYLAPAGRPVLSHDKTVGTP